MNTYALKNGGSNNTQTFYQNNIKQNLAVDQTAKGTINKPEFAGTKQSIGEITQAKAAWNKVQNLSPQIQDVQTQQIENVIQKNQATYYNGMSLDPKQASFLKQNQQIYAKVDGDRTMKNMERPLQDQTIGGGDAKRQMLINQAIVARQQAVQNFQPQYDAALSRQATDQKPIDQTKAIEEYNPDIVMQRQQFDNQLNRYMQLNQYTSYMNSFQNKDSRYHKIDPASMIKLNTFQTPTTAYLNNKQMNVQYDPRHIINQQTQGIQKTKLYNRSILDTQKINLFQYDSRHIVNQQTQPMPTITTQQTSNREMLYKFSPNQNYIQQQLQPQVHNVSSYVYHPGQNVKINYNNFIPKTQQDIVSGGGDMFNSSFLARRAGIRF